MKSAYYYHHYPNSNSASPQSTLARPWERSNVSTPRLSRRHLPSYRHGFDSASDITPNFKNSHSTTPIPDYDEDEPAGYVVRVRNKGQNFHGTEFQPSRLELAQKRHSRSCDQICRTEKDDDVSLYASVDTPPPLPPRKPKFLQNSLLSSPFLSDYKRKSIAIASPMTFRQNRHATTMDKKMMSREREFGDYRMNLRSENLHRSTLTIPVFDGFGDVYYDREFRV